MKYFYINLIVYSVWFALAAVFGLERYNTTGCQVTERYPEERSHRWSRIVAIAMMVAVEVMYWRPLNQLWVLWKMEEESGFFAFIYLGLAAYGLHRVFCLLVEYFEDISYGRAEGDAYAYSEHCANCCFRANGRVTELECPLVGFTSCPCLEAGHDIRDVNYLSEVVTALRRTRDRYQRRGLEMPSMVSIRVPQHRVVVKHNPFDELFNDHRWEFDIDLGFGYDNIIINEERPQSAKIIDFPAAAVVRMPEPETLPTRKSTTKRDLLQVRLIRGQYGAFELRMTEEGIACRLTRELPGDRIFDQQVTFPGTENIQVLDEFLLSEQGKLLHRFINTPTANLSEQQLAKLG